MIVLTDTSEQALQLEAEQRVHLEREADLLNRVAELEAEIVRNARSESQRLGIKAGCATPLACRASACLPPASRTTSTTCSSACSGTPT